MSRYLLTLLLSALLSPVLAQEYNQIDEEGNVTQRSENRNFNPHSNDSTSRNKEVPKGIYVWQVDRKLGDIIKADVDTIPHLYPQSTMAMSRCVSSARMFIISWMTSLPGSLSCLPLSR